MTNSKPWAPRTVPPELQAPLAVLAPKSVAMTPDLHRMLLADKLTSLVGKAEPWEKDEAAELLPDLQTAPTKDWPSLILLSDPMQAALSKIDWIKETKGPAPLQATVKEALDEESLASLLASL